MSKRLQYLTTLLKEVFSPEIINSIALKTKFKIRKGKLTPEIYDVLRYINGCLVNWVRRKYKKLKARRRAEHWLGTIAKRDKNLFAHWKLGILPSAG